MVAEGRAMHEAVAESVEEEDIMLKSLHTRSQE
jgi:hypothetical protein